MCALPRSRGHSVIRRIFCPRRQRRSFRAPERAVQVRSIECPFSDRHTSVRARLLRAHSQAWAYAASRYLCGDLSVLMSRLSIITDERALSGRRAMAYVQHLSVRIPWHDTGWTGTVCADPGANHACVMLGNGP